MKMTEQFTDLGRRKGAIFASKVWAWRNLLACRHGEGSQFPDEAREAPSRCVPASSGFLGPEMEVNTRSQGAGQPPRAPFDPRTMFPNGYSSGTE